MKADPNIGFCNLLLLLLRWILKFDGVRPIAKWQRTIYNARAKDWPFWIIEPSHSSLSSKKFHLWLQPNQRHSGHDESIDTWHSEHISRLCFDNKTPSQSDVTLVNARLIWAFQGGPNVRCRGLSRLRWLWMGRLILRIVTIFRTIS